MAAAYASACDDFIYVFIMCVFVQEQTQRERDRHAAREVRRKPATSDLDSHIFLAVDQQHVVFRRRHMRQDVTDAFRIALSRAVLSVP